MAGMGLCPKRPLGTTVRQAPSRTVLPGADGAAAASALHGCLTVVAHTRYTLRSILGIARAKWRTDVGQARTARPPGDGTDVRRAAAGGVRGAYGRDVAAQRGPGVHDPRQAGPRRP